MSNDFQSKSPALAGVVDGSPSTCPLPIAEDAALCSLRDAAALAGVLLPQEQLVLSARPHPIVWIRPAIRLFVGLIGLAVIGISRETLIIGGHHRIVYFVTTDFGRTALIVVGVFGLVQLGQVLSQLFYFLGFRVIATNRRVFVVRSFVDQSIRPLGNTGMARSSLKQTLFGRFFNYGTIYTGEGSLRDMRFPVALWRSLEAVAHGVENGQWKPAIRQTIIP
uniref:DUF304 domain-containing protein n=1 Tax=mine drainage metagenome TaxID=410659 RepID=E6Q2T4_9ZZZZ